MEALIRPGPQRLTDPSDSVSRKSSRAGPGGWGGAFLRGSHVSLLEVLFALVLLPSQAGFASSGTKYEPGYEMVK